MHVITELHTYRPIPSLLVWEWKWYIGYLLAVSSDLVACPNCTEWLHSCKVWLSGGEKEMMYIHDYKPHCSRSTGAGGHKGHPSHEPIITTACVHRCFSNMRQAPASNVCSLGDSVFQLLWFHVTRMHHSAGSHHTWLGSYKIILGSPGTIFKGVVVYGTA